MTACAELDFTCAFCGLACDDLRVRVDGSALRIVANACRISEAALQALSGVDPAQVTPRVTGRPARLDEAVQAAADILCAAHQPLFAGLGTDVAGARALMRLVRRCGAVTDHMNFSAKLRNVLTTQDRGWITTTFAEAKNRADLVLILGSDVGARFPRLFERLFINDAAMFTDTAAREIIYLGDPAKAQSCGAALGTREVEVIGCDNERLGEALGALRMLVSEHPAQQRLPASAGGVATSVLRALAQRLRTAQYAVLLWAAADFAFPHAELTIQRIAELAKDVNQFTRCAGLPLGGSDGDLSMNQVHVWQSGMALRSDFGGGAADYDPYNNTAELLLQRGEVDALLWVSSFSAQRLPPRTDLPSIVLGRVDMRLEREPEIFIPVGTPGVDHAGHFVRSDKVVTLRLKKLRNSALPSVAEAAALIEQACTRA